MASETLRAASPLRRERDGVIRVGGTRVPLETIVESYRDGATPEEIALQYPAIDLADAYAAIGFYLRRREQVEGYLREVARDRMRAREFAERRFNLNEIRERILARHRHRRTGCAS